MTSRRPKPDGECWTHKKLVRRMAQWLKTTQRMTVVIAELATRAAETPDVIAWHGAAASVLIECKTTRGDFLADRKKVFRQREAEGVGDRRFFAAPAGLLNPGDLPDGWGLLEVAANRVHVIVEPRGKVACKRNECVMLMSALRRLEISTAVYVVKEGEG